MSIDHVSSRPDLLPALLFPGEDALTLAITGGEIPESVVAQPVSARMDDDGTILIRLEGSLPPDALFRLAQLGIRQTNVAAGTELAYFSCWPQLLALRPAQTGTTDETSRTVLFEVPDPQKLPDLVCEMLRLGNDRQCYRFVRQPDGTTIALLKVVDPPYYSLLRALEKRAESHDNFAYEAIAEGVWVQCGYTYPLHELLRAPANGEILLRYPRDWRVVEGGDYRDIYDLIEFTLPAAPQWREETAAAVLIRVPLRLYRDENLQPAELWVMDTDALAQLEQLYYTLDESTRSRLLVALSERDDRLLAVIRSRPSREQPPVLEIAAEGYRRLMPSHPIFVPCGTRLQPAIRHSRLVELLSAGNERVVWLRPVGDGGFQPESLPDAAFQPLESISEIVIARSHDRLQEWVAATVFDFREFECPEEDEPSQPQEQTARQKQSTAAREDDNAPPSAKQARLFKVKRVRASSKPKPLPPLRTQRVSPSRTRIIELEKRFLAMPQDFDDPTRLETWLELARSYGVEERHESGLLCWTNVAWIAGSQYRQVVREWYSATCRNVSWSQILDPFVAGERLTIEELNRVVALCLASEAIDENLLPLAQLGKAAELLLSEADRLPARTIWLVGTAIARRSGGNDLLLTRIRDRLLRSWQRVGLPVLQNLPPFLRYCSDLPGEQNRGFHAFLHQLPEKLTLWIRSAADRTPAFHSDATLAFALAILAVGCRRLHEEPLAFELWDRAQGLISVASESVLEHGRVVYGTLLRALQYRFQEAAEHNPPTRSLPASMLEEIARLDRKPRYLIDQFRARLDSVEPGKRIDPYRTWMARYFNSLERELADLPDMTDPEAFQVRVRELLSPSGSASRQQPEARGKVICTALESASLLNDSWCAELLEEALALVEKVEYTQLRFALCEKAILAAGHFGYQRWTQIFVELFLERLGQEPRTVEMWTCLTSTAANTLHALRKLGLEQDLSTLIERLLEFIGQPGQGSRQSDTEQLRSLLFVAAGLFHSGDANRALPIVEAARSELFRAGLDAKRKTSLALAYVSALAQAPGELAVGALDELLEQLEGIEGALTTNDYFGLGHLEVADAIVRSVTSETFAIGQRPRRWLEEMEADLRRRMHEAAAAAVKPA